MATTVYFSRSFDDADQEIFRTIRDQFDTPEIGRRYDLELIDSEPPRGDQLAERIESDIAQSDVVVCLFTRRHVLEDEDGHIPPAYVTSETGFALGKGKRLIVFLEEGVPAQKMGLVDAHGIEYLAFSRDQIGTTEFADRVQTLIRSRLEEDRFTTNPPHQYLRYQVNQTIYPNGYVLAHYKVQVRLLRNEAIEHHVRIHPPEGGDVELSSAAELLERTQDDPCPYPRQAFIGFGARDDRVRVDPAEDDDPLQRSIQIHLPAVGEEYEYQWMWGSHQGFDPEREIESARLKLSHRAVQRVEVLFRMHESLSDRPDPRMAFVGGGTSLEPRNDETLRPYFERGETAHEPTERTPLYDCHWFEVVPVPTATDLLFLV